MDKQLENRLRAAIKDSQAAGPKHAVAITQADARRLLYRLLLENNPRTSTKTILKSFCG
jgi:hypothetical protein